MSYKGRENMFKTWLDFTALALLATTCLFADDAPRVQTFPLHDTAGLITHNAKTEAVKYLGRKSVRITMEGEDHEGLAMLPGTDFQDGVIEADIALKTTVPPGVRHPGFVGIAFRARPDASHYELFYLRPGNSEAADQAMRNHSVQYGCRASDGIGCGGNGLRCMSLTRTWPRRLGQKCGSKWLGAARNFM
jgi:hypothetical protein